jgi:hypothetical protein
MYISIDAGDHQMPMAHKRTLADGRGWAGLSPRTGHADGIAASIWEWARPSIGGPPARATWTDARGAACDWSAGSSTALIGSCGQNLASGSLGLLQHSLLGNCSVQSRNCISHEPPRRTHLVARQEDCRGRDACKPDHAVTVRSTKLPPHSTPCRVKSKLRVNSRCIARRDWCDGAPCARLGSGPPLVNSTKVAMRKQ